MVVLSVMGWNDEYETDDFRNHLVCNRVMGEKLR